MEKILSIGIPVYNVKEEYLRACLDSVIVNKSDQIEIVIVDDCSFDACEDICREYALRDNRIKLIRLEKNSGVSTARNTIIDNAAGKWLYFADADDLLSSDLFESVKQNDNTDADIIYYNYRIFSDSCEITDENLYIPLKPMDEENVKKLCIGHLCNLPTKTEDMILSAAVFNKMFRREFLVNNNLKFAVDVPISEDRLFLVSALLHNPKVYFSKQVTYFYRVNYLSATNRYRADILGITDRYLQYSEELINRNFANDNGIKELYLSNRVASALLDNFSKNIFHKDNPTSGKSRKQEFFKILECEPYKTALEEMHIDLCEMREKRILIKYAKKRNFFMLNMMYRYKLILRIYSTCSNRYERLLEKIHGIIG